jgi:hypothetical protein
LLITAALSSAAVVAYETDQYSYRDLPLADAAPFLNAEVNRAIQEVATEWRRDHRADNYFVTGIYRRIGGLHWVDQIERTAMESDEVERTPVSFDDNAFANFPLYASRVAGLFGLGATFEISGVRVGSDKLGHFLSQGRKFWLRFQRMDERAAARRSTFTESAIFGQPMTGRYSNADLVANYEGHRFYRSLFEDDIIPGKIAILRWEDGAYVIQREFDWADHVNIFWDEALMPNHYGGWSMPFVEDMLRGHCPSYAEHPELWAVPDWELLWERYADLLSLRDTRALRVDVFCANEDIADETPAEEPTD